jgi:ABC-type transport system involved in cytochrome c biogenesis permease subunit
MASGTLPEHVADSRDQQTDAPLVWPTIKAMLTPFASLKLTVVLFAMAIFIVFAGTLAQTQKDIWVVVREYFRTTTSTFGFAWIDFQIFFPKAFFPNMKPVGGGFWFPGGWLIGAAMAVNLLAAHAVRFTVQSSGRALSAGLGVIGLGSVITWFVVMGGSGSEGMQGRPFFEWSTLWFIVKVLLAALALGGGYLVSSMDSKLRIERWLLGAVSAAFGLLALWLFAEGENAALGDSSMRILWQLLQGGLAGLVLLAGCWLVFKKRAGIVLLHAGVGLLMLSELLVGMQAQEAIMFISEGDVANFAQDIREVELAIVDPSDPKEETVVVVPQEFLKDCALIQNDLLPFDLRIVKFMQNSELDVAKPGDENPATAGTGRQIIATEAKASVGASSSSAVDESAAYVEVLKKGTTESLGTYLVSVLQSRLEHSRSRAGMPLSELRSRTGPFLLALSEPTTVPLGDKKYDLSLRFKRIYKPYTLKLDDVKSEKYLGTETARNFSSDVEILDGSGEPRTAHIWMNNPLRYAGETFYQSQVDVDRISGKEQTGLQVVSNTGWMLPYVSCMIVGVGMLFQFSITLLRFLNRRDRTIASTESQEPGRAAPPNVSERASSNRPARSQITSNLEPKKTPWLEYAFTAAVVLGFGGYTLSFARAPHVPDDAFNFTEAGKIPVVYQGRVKPLDTLARNTLKIISWKESYKDENKKTQPAVRWLFDVMAGTEDVEKHRVFWIDHPALLDLFGLSENKQKSHLYSIADLQPKMEEFEKQVKEARELPAEKLSVDQRRLLELDGHIRTMTLLMAAFRIPPLPELPSPEAIQQQRPEAIEAMAQLRVALVDAPKQLAKFHPPLAVPIKKSNDFLADEKNADGPGEFIWQPYSTAFTKSYVKTRLLSEEADPATAAWNQILVAYRKGEAKTFNDAVRDYRRLLASDPPAELKDSRADFETFFNRFAPFYGAAMLYIIAFVFAALGWLFWTGPMNRTSFWLIVTALCVHSFALIARMYISGRPPVTNLYSTAVFIGWGIVAMCLMFELIFKMGVGNVLAGVTGFCTLLIAHFLSADGDTFTVLVAVLDTQFWLATHVVIINFGYAATLLAGVMGCMYVLRGVLTPSLDERSGKNIVRMIYGTLCFAIFFSFVGTVLGGLWADDSWGRFWGWDPKENGALIIVLWNVLVLHARWDGMVKDRGLAVLAIAGNIMTGWSWFGVNELGVGLHSYGFTDGVLKWLGIFVATQLAVIAAGCLPRDLWMSDSRTPPTAA